MLLLIFSFSSCSWLFWGNSYTTYKNYYEVCFNYRNSWSSWEGGYDGIYAHHIGKNITGLQLQTRGKIIYFDFNINNYKEPTKKEIKKHLKNGEWYEYKGVVSYYVSDSYPTASQLAKYSRFVRPDPRTDKTPTVMRTTEAIIKIQPYKKHPTCFNVYFDDIGVGISLNELEFNLK